MYKRFLSFSITALIAVSSFNIFAALPQSAAVPFCNDAANPEFEVAFSPQQGATDLIVANIRNAKKSIRVAAYTFTSKPIAMALIAAQQRGVDVKIVVDKRQIKDRSSLYQTFLDNKVSIRANDKYKIMHNKFMIFDDRTLELGSFNYSQAAEHKNAENVLVIHNSAKLTQIYLAEWQKLWDES